MRIVSTVLTSLKSLRRNPTRTLLTTLGIIIGIDVERNVFDVWDHNDLYELISGNGSTSGGGAWVRGDSVSGGRRLPVIWRTIS